MWSAFTYIAGADVYGSHPSPEEVSKADIYDRKFEDNPCPMLIACERPVDLGLGCFCFRSNFRKVFYPLRGFRLGARQQRFDIKMGKANFAPSGHFALVLIITGTDHLITT